MKKELFLIRHAKAESESLMLPDITRDLVPQGFSEAAHIGKTLYDKGLHFDLLLTSPANRTQKTAELIAEQLQYNTAQIMLEPLIYEASVRNLMQVINGLDHNLRHVALVGHNPGISHLSEALTGEPLGMLPTCSVVQIVFENVNWDEVSSGLGKLIAIVYPNI